MDELCCVSKDLEWSISAQLCKRALCRQGYYPNVAHNEMVLGIYGAMLHVCMVHREH